jgi:hypothetical protein
MPINEADTCQTYVVPKLYSAGWKDTLIGKQMSFTDGRIMHWATARSARRHADSLLRYRRVSRITISVAPLIYLPTMPAKVA